MKYLSKVVEKMKKVIHQTYHLSHNRQVIIAVSVLVSLFSAPIFLNGYDYSYMTNYTISFYRSLLVFFICFIGWYITDSKRLVGLLGFIVVSMLFDLAYIYSPDYYYLLNDLRRKVTYNFSDMFQAYEITCLLISILFGLKYVASNNDNTHGTGDNSIHQRANLRDEKT